MVEVVVCDNNRERTTTSEERESPIERGARARGGGLGPSRQAGRQASVFSAVHRAEQQGKAEQSRTEHEGDEKERGVEKEQDDAEKPRSSKVEKWAKKVSDGMMQRWWGLLALQEEAVEKVPR